MGLEIIAEITVAELPEEEMKRLTRIVLEKEGQRGKEVALLLADDAKIRNLNKSFRKIAEPTDVLAFPMEGDQEILGDIAISVDRAERQATKAGHTLTTEIKYLLLHGLLHLCGYDHENGKNERWKRAEEKYLDLVFGARASVASRGS
jgi:probable rRNA maturation factor